MERRETESVRDDVTGAARQESHVTSTDPVSAATADSAEVVSTVSPGRRAVEVTYLVFGIIEGLLAIYDIPRISQVQLIYRARLLDEAVQAGQESLEVGLFEWEEIPWGRLAFPSVGWALQHDREARATRDFTARINPPGS